ncbi:MAG: toxin-antitoxin system YwqK family antitoxin [Proteobacteria bacterium]|nr:toxin-antitoxin system YwqK family antitoxin [Pseudomonadota bacterium]
MTRFRPLTRALPSALALVALWLSTPTKAEGLHLSCPPGHEEGRSENPIQVWCEKDGSRDGIFREFYPSGKIKAEAVYRNHERQGPYHLYSESGELLSEGFYERGQMSGHWLRRNEEGAPRDEGDWKNDAPHGLWRLYSEGGFVGSEGYFENGARVCDWYSYPPSGGFSKESTGVPVNGKCDDFSIRPRYRHTRSRLDLFRFTFGIMNLDQESGGSTRTFVFGAIPQGRISPRINWFASASFGFLPTRTPGQSWSLITDLAPGIRIFTPGPEWLFVDLSAGVQTLLKSGTRFTTSLGIGVDPALHGILLRLQSKSVHDHDNPAQEIVLGVELTPEFILGIFR